MRLVHACLLVALAAPAVAQSPFDSLRFRSIGPAAAGGRIHDIEVDPGDPAVIYVASASGGIWKSTNHATSWKPLETLPENTFGDLAIFPGDPRIIWAGTGEQNNRQSSSWGTGVYRSTDGGSTWTHLGLRETSSIGRVRLHPTDPNVAYVAAVGNLWKASGERGLYKTVDAGRSWSRVLFVDTLTGATDVAIDPRDPNVLYVATYQRIRSAFGFNGGGPGSAIWKSTDAGATWSRLENGVPSGDKGRIGLAIAPSNPSVLIALIEHPTGSGTYRTEDGGATWRRMSGTNPRPMYYSKPFIDPTTDRRIWVLGVTVFKSEDGGTTFQNMPNSPTYDVGLKTDHHTMWINPANPRHIMLGGDGGLNESWDLGLTYTRLNNIPNGQFYRIAVDDRDPYWIYGGLQDNHSWMGPSQTRHWLGIVNSDWIQIGFSDGTGHAVDKANGRVVYSSSSGGGISRVDPVTGDRQDIRPVPPQGDSAYRFDWDAPVVASRHTAGTVYIGGNKLFISRDHGSTWTATKDLTRMVMRDSLQLGGVVNRNIRISRNDGESNFSEITTMSESPLDPRVLWVGTDDGNVQVSSDAGATWTEVSRNIPVVSNGTFVGRVVASAAARGAAYVAFDAHRTGDFAPYLVRTTDFGKTWKTVTAGLPPDAPVRSIVEYPGKPNVAFLGTERHLFVTRDSGSTWTRITSNVPTTRFDDLIVHPRTKDLILGTHGRSIWILDDASPIAEWTPQIAAKKIHLFAVPRATLMLYWEDISNVAHGFYSGDNPPDGATFSYHLGAPAQSVRFIVRNAAGTVVREVSGSTNAGVIQRAVWDLRWPPAPPGLGGRGSGGGDEGGPPPTMSGGGRGNVVQLPIPSRDIGNRGIQVSPGTYTVTLKVDGDSTMRAFEVRGDPASSFTVMQWRAREAFLLDVQDTQMKIQSVLTALRTRRAQATPEEQARLQALERRLTVAAGRIGRIAGSYNGSGAQQGSFAPPTGQQRNLLNEAKAELRAVSNAASERPPAARQTAQWWREAVCYEVFVRSFSDANGDGIGDLQGLTARLDYINDGTASTTGDLGANCIWLMPIAKSPSYHGYDVTDYYHVNPDYGTDGDFRQLMTEAHRRGIRVIVDFVPNHSSSQHPFFQAALRDPASPYRAWYRWSATKPELKGPWGQEVWHRSPVRDEYYYGIFWGGMPDLNYETPAVRREMERAAIHWVTEMGADGLRVDAVPHLMEAGSQMQHAGGTHAVLREFGAAVRRAAPNAFTIGEAWTDSVPLLSRYYPDQLDAYFGFPVADATLDAASTGDARRFLEVLARTNGLLPASRWAPFLTNHDTPRVMTKLRGNIAQARVAAMAMMTLPGTPFIYYGEELGMRGDKPDEQIRTPMQWSSDHGAGFTQGKPWEAPQPDWQTVNVAAQESDTSSLLHLYRRLIRLRLDEPALRHGDLTLARSSNGAVAAYLRRTGDATSVVVVNFGAEGVDRVAVDFIVPSCGERKPSIGRLFGDATAGVEYSPAGVTVTNLAARQAYIYALRCG